MPPFNKMPPKQAYPRKFIVQVTLCQWCKVRVGRKCPVCSLPTCYMCLQSADGGSCVHQTYNPVESTGWGSDCPNPMCDVECNVCMGRGIV